MNSIPYIAISDFVSKFCLATYNDKRKFFPTILTHAQMIYKRLFLNTIRTTKSVYCIIETTKDGRRFIKIPNDCVRVYNIHSVTDCGDLRPYYLKQSMNEVPVPTNTSLVCNQCGNSDDYSAYINTYTATTKLVVIDGDNYYEKEWTKVRRSGDLVKIVETPVKKFTDEDTYTIEYVTTERLVSRLDTEPCGCLKKTDRNQEIIISACGCIIPCGATCFNNIIKERVAKIKQDERRIYLQNALENYAILSYQTNGECGLEEILIPEEAEMTMMFGVKWLAEAFNPVGNRFVARELKANFEEEENNLFAFLNPLRINEFLKNQGNFYKWGGGYNDCDTDITGYSNVVKASIAESQGVSSATQTVTTSPSQESTEEF